MKVVWTATAVARLEAIEEFIAVDNPDAATRFIEALLATGESLVDTHQRGRLVPELPGSGLRELIHKNYRLIYRATEKRVEILTVFEGHRRLQRGELE